MNLLSKATHEPKKVLLNKCFDILEYDAPRMLDAARRLANNPCMYFAKGKGKGEGEGKGKGTGRGKGEGEGKGKGKGNGKGKVRAREIRKLLIGHR
jgi:hypothetical protein